MVNDYVDELRRFEKAKLQEQLEVASRVAEDAESERRYEVLSVSPLLTERGGAILTLLLSAAVRAEIWTRLRAKK